jgi:hypothetical protein
MKSKITLLLLVLSLSGCSSTRIEQATFTDTTINSATWKSQAGVGSDASIEAATQAEADISGL